MRKHLHEFRVLYGEGPLHLLGGLASLAVVAIAVSGWFEEPAISLKYILIWFVGAILAHDMILLPIYSTLERIASRRLRRASMDHRNPAHTRVHGWVYVRVPTLLSGLILLVFGAEILERGDHTFHVASGQHQGVYLGRYLLIVAALFGFAALTYLIARVRGRST